MNDSKIVSTMTVAGEQVAPTLYQNSTEKRSDEPAKTSATMNLLKFFLLLFISRVSFQVDLPIVDRAIDGLGYAGISQRPRETNSTLGLI
jgi:hypothetical protein